MLAFTGVGGEVVVGRGVPWGDAQDARASPLPPPVHPPRPCASPPRQPERLVMRKDEAVCNKKKMQVCLPKHNYILSSLFENLRKARDKTLVCKYRSELKLVEQSY